MREGDLVASFREQGYVSPVPLFSPEECEALLRRLGERQRAPLDWNKSHAVTSPEFYALGADDRILDLVTGLIGEDVVLWGAQLLVRAPGYVHAWHTDIESSSPAGGTVSVWIGLANTDVRSSLKVVPFSHRFGVTLQQVTHERGRDRSSVTDADVAAWAAERDERSGVLRTETVDGEALLFDGRLWHGSHNVNRRGRRIAALLQYSTPETAIRIPVPRPQEWPFAVYRAPRPACILVSGRDVHALNRIVPGPAARHERLPALTSCIQAIELPLAREVAPGHRSEFLFEGSTADLTEVRCHVSELDPGGPPHPVHWHGTEELVVVLAGVAGLIVEDGSDSGGTSRVEVGPGSFTYYPSGFAHTIEAASAEPVAYLLLKWRTQRKAQGPLLAHRVVEHSSEPAEGRDGISGTRVLDGETKYLRHLYAHVTTLEPGAGYEPHVDSYDVAIVVLEGTVETLGEQVGRHGVIFYAAGEPHGMRNPGTTRARYLVFELRGRHSSEGAADRRLSRRLRAVLRDPRRLRAAAAQAARSLLRPARSPG